MWQKLKHEWKTFTLSVLTILVGLNDTISASGYDLTPIIPEDYRPVAVPVIGVSFLLLRQWKPKKDKDVDNQ